MVSARPAINAHTSRPVDPAVGSGPVAPDPTPLSEARCSGRWTSGVVS
jgi:hypothetical protein